MPSHPIPPSPPVLPVSARTRRRLDQMTAALEVPARRAALARASWLPAAAAESLALADDPEFRRLAAGFRALEARRQPGSRRADPPRGLRTLLGRLDRRYPQAFAAFRAVAREAALQGDDGRAEGGDVRTVVLVPHAVVYIVLVPGRGQDEPGRAFLQALARMPSG